MTGHSTNRLLILFAALLIVFASLPAYSGIIYVDVNRAASPDTTGASWTDALVSIHAAIDTAVSSGDPIDTIWVAAGTYYPDPTDRSVSFTLASGVRIYGGFAGGETSILERDWLTNETILSGDIGLTGDAGDNSYHVVAGSGVDSTAVLDGFTVILGNADGAAPDYNGGGIHLLGGNPVIANVTVAENNASNYAGGIYCSGSRATVTNAVFHNNSAITGGGGMAIHDGSAPTVLNSVFIGNTCSYRWGGGGGISHSSSSSTLINLTLVGNDAGTGYGGAISGYDSYPLIINAVIWGNTAENSYNPQIWNNISYPQISFSLIEGCGGSGAWVSSYGEDYGGNIDADPLFADSDYRLKAVSPAVNSGNDAAPGLPATDIDGNPRIAGIAVDMGAYERPCPAAAVVYVDDGAAGQNDGTSWTDAFNDLKEALEWASCGGVTEIWVAGGTYVPTSGSDRGATFRLVDGVALYGGFAGTETDVAERDSLGGETILSGDIGTPGYAEDNSYHVVTGSGTDSTAVLNGFTVTGGYANGSGTEEYGAGMYVDGGSPVIANMTFSGNFAAVIGGGVYLDGSSPLIVNTLFTGNHADHWGGGGLFSDNGSSPTVVNCVFTGNTVSYSEGGGAALSNSHGSNPTLVNVTIYDNHAYNGYAGAMNSYQSSPKLFNVIIWGNTADRGYNPQIWNNDSYPRISYSLVEGSGGSGTGWDGSYGLDYGGNIDEYPQFFDGPGGDLRLLPGSPAVDAGAVDSLPPGIENDFGGNPRIVEASVDMGAYESQVTCPPGSVIYVDADATGEYDGTSWTDAFNLLQDALGWAAICPGVTQIWVAEGTYIPDTDSLAADRNATFRLLDGISIYGGFQGVETELSQRDWEAYVTVLSGDIGAPGDSTDNCYHVVTSSGTGATAVLDGFTITGGNADASVTAPAPVPGVSLDSDEMAKDVKPTLSGSPVTGSRAVTAWIDTHGGGVENIGGSPVLRNLVITGNYAADGGGMYNDSGSPMLMNVRFEGNTGIWGGAIHNWDDGSPILVNVLFTGNTADFGGGLYNNWCDPDLVNVTMFGNEAYRGGGIYNNFCDLHLVNTIMWADSAGTEADGHEIYNASASPAVSYSLVAGSGGSASWDPAFGSDGGGNVDADPMFLDAAGADLHLRPGSPAMDSGDNAADGIAATDIEGGPRITSGTIDMGVYEFQGPPCPSDSVLYVDASATGAGTGDSWADAFTDLTTALFYTGCPGVTEIWVAAGTYYPASDTSRAASFELVSGTGLYGGFAGTETYRYERDWKENVAVLSGDIGLGGVADDNSYHVVTGSGVDSTAVLDGFTITLGRADGTGSHNSGGGIRLSESDPVIANVILEENYAINYAGGIYCLGSSPTITNALFTNNSTVDGGGGMTVHGGGSPTVINSVFFGNSCSYRWGGGGGIAHSSSSSTLINVTMVNNDAGTGYGGGIFNYDSDPTLINVIIRGNTAENSFNPQIWNNASYPQVSFSLLEGCGGSGAWVSSFGEDYGDNIDADPLLVDEFLGDLRLYPGSPAIDAGDSSSVPPGLAFDIAGNPRVLDANVDMGAYEFQGTCPPDTVLYVDADATGRNDGASWADAFTELRYALGWAQHCPGVTQVWVAEGLYIPTAGTDRGATFQLTDSLALYGGFAGGETALSMRDHTVNIAELNGGIGTVSPDDNCYHVVTGSGVNESAVLDGFLISGGYADGGGADDNGGGIYISSGSPRIFNTTVNSNYAAACGGGIYTSSGNPDISGVNLNGNNSQVDGGGIYVSSGSPRITGVLLETNHAGNYGGGICSYGAAPPADITGVTFLSNSADAHGGGMYTEGSFHDLRDVVFTDNFAGDRGGGMFINDGSIITITNAVIANNYVLAIDLGGGGIYNHASDVTLVNSTVAYNNAQSGWGGGIFSLSTTLTIANSIICENTAVQGDNPQVYNNITFPVISYSLLQGCGGSGPGWDYSYGLDYGGNIDADPMFTAPPIELRLSAGSPAINAGENSLVPAGVTTDLDGNPRISDVTVDMGPYEYQTALAAAFPSPMVFEEVPMNESTCDTLYFTNGGGETCTITGIYGCTTAPFGIDTSMTEHVLAPGGTTGIAVCVYPTAAAPDSADLTIVSDAWNSPTVVEVRLSSVTVVASDDRTPQPFRIVSVAPNPFNPTTTVYFTLPEAMPVTATVYSVTGARVRVLADRKRFQPGENRITWNGLSDRGATVASGMYFIRVKTKLGVKIARVVMLR